MATYKNPEMRKSMQQMKEKSRRIKITGGTSSVREPLATSSKRAGSMTSSGLPKTTTSSKKPATSMARSTKRSGTPVPLPKKPGNIATGSKKTARPKPAGKITKKPIAPRKRIDVSKMTPAQKQAYYNQPGYDNY
jgi:hypothetical protein